MGCRRCEGYEVCSDAAPCKPFCQRRHAFFDKLKRKVEKRLCAFFIKYKKMAVEKGLKII